MSSRDNAIEAALIEAASIRNRIYVFAEDEDGYCAVNEEECDPADFASALGFAEYDPKRKESVWTII